MDYLKTLKKSDKKAAKIILAEEKRQAEGLEMIPSENYVSRPVLEALGTVFTNKYSEGYPKKRYYGGNQIVDRIELLAQERAKKLFGVRFANVQPYSGSPANHAVYFALCKSGDVTMGMDLACGGHITHGLKVNFSGIYYRPVYYTVDKKTSLIDYDEVKRVVKKHRPKLIWAGATAYPRLFDWKKFAQIARSVDAYLACDIAHYAGLVAGGAYLSPVKYADVVTTTTHKTLRGPRGAMIMTNDEEIAKKINKAVFPGLQGGPHNHQTAAIAVSLKEASKASFKRYAHQIVKNCKALAKELKKYGFNLVTGGTDNHLILIDLRNKKVSGKEVQEAMENVGISLNKNSIPYDPNPPFRPSGIRLGTPALTSQGMKKKEMKVVADLMNETVEAIGKKRDKKRLKAVKKKVVAFARQFPVPGLDK